MSLAPLLRRVGPPDISWCAKSTAEPADKQVAETPIVQKAIREFVAGLSMSERKSFLEASRTDLALFHFGAGSRVRERYFSSNSEVRQASCGTNMHAYCDIDGASMIIVEKAWDRSAPRAIEVRLDAERRFFGPT